MCSKRKFTKLLGITESPKSARWVLWWRENVFEVLKKLLYRRKFSPTTIFSTSKIRSKIHCFLEISLKWLFGPSTTKNQSISMQNYKVLEQFCGMILIIWRRENVFEVLKKLLSLRKFSPKTIFSTSKNRSKIYCFS